MIGASPLPTYTGRVLTEAIAAGNARPRVVTVFVLDAMRADYFDKYASIDADADADAQGRRVVFARRARSCCRRSPASATPTSAPAAIRASTASSSTPSSTAPPASRRKPTISSIRRELMALTLADQVEPRDRRQGDHHRPGRRDPRDRRTRRPRRMPDQRQEDHRRQLRRRRWRLGNQSRPATRCPRR